MVDSHEILVNEEADKLLDNDQLVQEAIDAVENNGIVFLDEIDKICVRDGRSGGDVSREGVQRDLLPLIEGTTVSTKHGAVKTDHILFIASGAFHIAKPSDLLPELQGRLPIRVELNALTRDDMRRILTEPEASLIKQYVALLQTEGVTLEFADDAIDALADVAVAVNSTVENIGARRLQTVMERVLDEISFVGARPQRRDHPDRRRLRAEARRRSGEERRSEPVYFVAAADRNVQLASFAVIRGLDPRIHRSPQTCSARGWIAGSSPATTWCYLAAIQLPRPPHPHIQRAFAAVADMGFVEADHLGAEFRQAEPMRHLAAQHAALRIGPTLRPLPVITSTKLMPS